MHNRIWDYLTCSMLCADMRSWRRLVSVRGSVNWMWMMQKNSRMMMMVKPTRHHLTATQCRPKSLMRNMRRNYSVFANTVLKHRCLYKSLEHECFDMHIDIRKSVDRLEVYHSSSFQRFHWRPLENCCLILENLENDCKVVVYVDVPIILLSCLWHSSTRLSLCEGVSRKCTVTVCTLCLSPVIVALYVQLN